ncbi:putative glycosyltransferase [Triangularia verruculosa]|uniref:Glycosyltransferase n=1 Tax=Triangularia verruculosa TaxID=2587418 RepID=A0AAN6XDD2_9PEZI|nr:putative glycosyltransferase [Triangularia verruculosa]
MSSDRHSDETLTTCTVLLVVGTGGLTHAAPVLELGRLLANRGHTIVFATHRTQEKWILNSPSYSFISPSNIHNMGDPLAPEQEEAHYAALQAGDIRADYKRYFAPKYTIDGFWTADYHHLLRIVKATAPDMIVSDFFVEATRDMQKQFGIPLAMVWPQMPYGMVSASHIPGIPGFQVDALSSEHATLWQRIRAALRPFRAVTTVVPYLRWVKKMRREAGVRYSLAGVTAGKPDYLALVNSFWGLETPKDCPPLLQAVGPILSEEYPELDDELRQFYEKGKKRKVVYVCFGTHITLPTEQVAILMGALGDLLEDGLVDGVVWAVGKLQRKQFQPLLNEWTGGMRAPVSNLLENNSDRWYFTPFAPQRAVLDHPGTVLFVSHGGGSSVNEALYHGVRLLPIGFFFDQPLNGLRIEEAGVGVALDKARLTRGEIYDKSRQVLLDEHGSFARNVERMRHIARISARKKHHAVDLIEEMMYDAKFGLDPNTGKTRPMHLQTADARMPLWKSKNLDMVVLGGLAAAGFAGASYWFYSWISERL